MNTKKAECLPISVEIDQKFSKSDFLSRTDPHFHSPVWGLGVKRLMLTGNISFLLNLYEGRSHIWDYLFCEYFNIANKY